MRVKIKTISILTVLLLAVFVSTTVSAQILPKFGVKAGANFATLNNIDDVEYKTGFIGGVFVDFSIPMTPVSIQPEILYAQYGTAIKDSDVKLDVNYLQIPVLIKFGFPTPVVNPNVYFGPYYGHKLSSSIRNDDITLNINSKVVDSDFGIVIGAGVNVTKVRFDLRYTAGFTELENSAFNKDAKNGAFALTVGVAL